MNPERTGTKAALRYRLEAAPGETAEIRLRLAPERRALDARFEQVVAARRADADELYAGFDAQGDRAHVLRQALAGMLWSRQFFHYDVERWLDGDPGRPAPPPERRRVRNPDWTHLVNADVVSMPDTWEYPWYAAWDLAFHTLPLALVDAELAKNQLLLLTRTTFMHPNGQLPAYEWNFSDTNPPVHAWAALRVFELDGSRDFAFLEQMLHKLLLNFGWWVNRKDIDPAPRVGRDQRRATRAVPRPRPLARPARAGQAAAGAYVRARFERTTHPGSRSARPPRAHARPRLRRERVPVTVRIPVALPLLRASAPRTRRAGPASSHCSSQSGFETRTTALRAPAR